MNFVNSLELSRDMCIPFKLLQKLSLSQTKMIEFFSQNIPKCFQDYILSSDIDSLQGILFIIIIDCPFF